MTRALGRHGGLQQYSVAFFLRRPLRALSARADQMANAHDAGCPWSAPKPPCPLVRAENVSYLLVRICTNLHEGRVNVHTGTDCNMPSVYICTSYEGAIMPCKSTCWNVLGDGDVRVYYSWLLEILDIPNSRISSPSRVLGAKY